MGDPPEETGEGSPQFLHFLSFKFQCEIRLLEKILVPLKITFLYLQERRTG